MKWSELYTALRAPTEENISSYIGNPLWDRLCREIEGLYAVRPKIEYSRCSMAPGWNVKYKKSGKALCTLYPGEGAFDCMVVVQERDAARAEFFLSACADPATRAVYEAAKPSNGARWLMLRVAGEQSLQDALGLISLRVPPSGRRPA